MLLQKESTRNDMAMFKIMMIGMLVFSCIAHGASGLESKQGSEAVRARIAADDYYDARVTIPPCSFSRLFDCVRSPKMTFVNNSGEPFLLGFQGAIVTDTTTGGQRRDLIYMKILPQAQFYMGQPYQQDIYSVDCSKTVGFTILPLPDHPQAGWDPIGVRAKTYSTRAFPKAATIYIGKKRQ